MCGALTLHDVHKRFGTSTVLEHITLDIAAGRSVSIVGPSGCGKSTLLKILAGLLAPTSGRVDVFGQPLTGINRRASYMFQEDVLLPWKTVLQNIQFGLTLRHVDNALLASRIEAKTLMCVGLRDTVCPPSTVFAAYNAIGSPKEIDVLPYSGHEVPSAYAERQLADFVQTFG